MVATNTIEDQPGAGDTANWTESTDQDEKNEGHLLGALEHSHDVICDPELDTADHQVDAGQCEKCCHECRLGEHVTNLLLHRVVSCLHCFDLHLFDADLREGKLGLSALSDLLFLFFYFTCN